MYQLKFTLKQHTPLIHFQHDQEGATLRASEVKPKLDRFIIEKLVEKKGQAALDDFKHKTSKKIKIDNNWVDNPYLNSDWLNMLVGKSNQHLAFDYKLKFHFDNSKKELFYFTSSPKSKNDESFKEIVSNNFEAEYINKTQYFANNSNLKPKGIEKEDEIKLGIFAGEITGEIISFKSSLIKKIENCLIDFFISQNFASRQSKGFGCFTIEKINEEQKHFRESDLLKSYSVVYKTNSHLKTYIEAIQKISQVYKLIRSGQGAKEDGGYKKSLLFLYFLSLKNPYRWEKRKIKQKINSNMFMYMDGDDIEHDIKLTYENEPCLDASNNKSWCDPFTLEYKYIRALLGLNETFEFQAEPIKDGLNNQQMPNFVKFKYIVKVGSNNEIERFRSPITFKFINGHIYLCCNPISSEILNNNDHAVSFNFELGLKKNNVLIDRPHFKKPDLVTNLETPSEFDIEAFLKFCFEGPHNNKINGFNSINKI